MAEKRGVTPLMEACLHGYKNIVEELLHHGADVKLISEFGGALSHAVGANANLKIVKLLLENGANVDERSSIYEGETPLFCACRCGQLKVVKLLIEAGANVNAINDLDNTPLQEMVDNYSDDMPKDLKKIYPHIIATLLVHGGRTEQEYM